MSELKPCPYCGEQVAEDVVSDVGWHFVYCTTCHAEREALQAKLDGLEMTTYCAYCGERFALDDKAATFVTKHIHTCPDHPMRLIEIERNALIAKLDMAVEAMKLARYDVRINTHASLMRPILEEALKRLEENNVQR